MVDRRARSRHDPVVGLGPFLPHCFERAFPGQADDLAWASLAAGTRLVLLEGNEMHMRIARPIVMDGGDPWCCPTRDLFGEVAHEGLVLVRATLSWQGDDETFGNASVAARHGFVPLGQDSQIGAAVPGQPVAFAQRNHILAVAADIAQPCRRFADPAQGCDPVVLQ